MADPLILTARFDAATAATLQRLRDLHFPADRNIVPAHLTLFHHLPGTDEPAIIEALRRHAAATAALPFTVPGLRFLGRGVAVAIDCPGLAALRDAFAAGWREALTAQDRQGFRPHVTIQNKVTPAAARALFDGLAPGFTLPPGTVDGLALWRYRGGSWEDVAQVRFGGG